MEEFRPEMLPVPPELEHLRELFGQLWSEMLSVRTHPKRDDALTLLHQREEPEIVQAIVNLILLPADFMIHERRENQIRWALDKFEAALGDVEG